MINVIGRWGDLLDTGKLRQMPDPTARHTVLELQKMLDIAHDDFDASAKNHPLDSAVSRVRDGH